MNDFPSYLFGCVVGLVVGLAAFWFLIIPSKDARMAALKEDAIKNGVAEYVIINPSTGETKFQWKTPQKP